MTSGWLEGSTTIYGNEGGNQKQVFGVESISPIWDMFSLRGRVHVQVALGQQRAKLIGDTWLESFGSHLPEGPRDGPPEPLQGSRKDPAKGSEKEQPAVQGGSQLCWGSISSETG